jgi:hypothetical protein
MENEFVIAGTALLTLLVLSVIGCIIGVAIHFIRKYW